MRKLLRLFILPVNLKLLSIYPSKSIAKPVYNEEYGKVIAIDFGSANARVGLKLPNETEIHIMQDTRGRRSIPTKICFLDEILIGHEAQENGACSSRTISHLCQLLTGSMISTSEDLTAADDRQLPFTERIDVRIQANINGSEVMLRPEQIVGFFFQQLKSKAEEFYGDSISNVIISVPAYFNDEQRGMIRRALSFADLHALRVIDESDAILKAYGLGELPLDEAIYGSLADKQNLNILVYDFGETFEAAVYVLDDVYPDLLSTAGTGPTPALQSQVDIGGAQSAVSLERTIELSLKAYDDSLIAEPKYFSGAIDVILLSGKSSSNPRVKELLSAAFPGAFMPSLPSSLYFPENALADEQPYPLRQEEAVVFGLSFYSSRIMKIPKEEDMPGIRRLFVPIITRNSIYPLRRSRTINLTSSQRIVRVFEGTGSFTNHSVFMKMVGTIDVASFAVFPDDIAESSHPEITEVEFTMSVNDNATAITVEAREVLTNRSVSSVMLLPQYTQEEVSRIIAEALKGYELAETHSDADGLG
ncbi:hypothetical protein D9758_011910 [Tetrapyrgos nigripes]|uniref:Uncharacterized protein n=1 Tax=Tetrapyrgos nigripes TaxID=182062 RepID=A0A8H5FQD3_9AGAR|nr:hypothetical protein D9758_011910 [Tetrapyrgos nigripes]